MPKMKTHKATVKRLKVSGSGKLMHKQSGIGHILSKKSKKRKRKLAILKPVAACDTPRFKKLISPGGKI
ncbi:MAG: 50S ribosomal protein L35 [Planctomycetales bacterium]|nr:50S ribosomal protein L35 [bacterium]UNM07349.1 MAG: 50S ribosomal protein L35 [Planctomycetales bacterium]